MTRRLSATMVLAVLASVLVAAQTQHYVQWDPNPTTDNVTQYLLTFDSSGFSVPPTVDASCNCVSWPIPSTLLTNGSHTVSVQAVNTWGTSGPAALTFNVSGPGVVKNVRIK